MHPGPSLGPIWFETSFSVPARSLFHPSLRTAFPEQLNIQPQPTATNRPGSSSIRRAELAVIPYLPFSDTPAAHPTPLFC